MSRKRKTSKKTHAHQAQGSTTVNSEMTDQLLADIRAHHTRLLAEQNRLQQEIAAVSEAMQALGGAGAGAVVARSVPAGTAAKPLRAKRAAKPVGRRGRQSSVPSLKDYVVRVLGDAKEPMRVKDIENGIVSAGYTTKGKSLPNQVSMALADLAKTRKVKKVARGLYRG